MNTESLELILNLDRVALYARVAFGCGFIAVLVIGRLKGLI